MHKFGYFRVAAVSPLVRPADIDHNVSEILQCIKSCASMGVQLAVFPELSVTGYTCADLFGQELLLKKAVEALETIAKDSKEYKIVAIVGAPIICNGRLFNCAVVISNGKILGIVPKSHIPNYGEFYERRWFASALELQSDIELQIGSRNVMFGTHQLFELDGVRFGIEICEDLWVPNPPSSRLCMAGADVILNLSASPELIGKHKYLLELISAQSARCRCGYVYASAGTGESSTDLAFCGKAIVAENGVILAESKRFELGTKISVADLDIQILRADRLHFNTFHNDSSVSDIHIHTLPVSASELPDAGKYRKINAHPFVDSNPNLLAERCNEISSIQSWGLAMRLKAIGCKKAVVGISGGLDSTLALLVTVKAFDMLGLDRKGIIGITMPGFGTTHRTKSNADLLMEILGVTRFEIPIGEAVKVHFKDIGHDGFTPDVTYENSQARERTQILMDVANKENAIVIGTGDLSELALGWCTYNGDQMSMYAVNASIPKTLVKYLVSGYADATNNPTLHKVLTDIIDTPISPELIPADSDGDIAQKTEDLVGPYELHDFFMFNLMRYGMPPSKIFHLARKAFYNQYSDDEILHWLATFSRRFFSQQFKRSCMPDGVKVGSVCLSPRGDWRMPSDASSALWNKEIENLNESLKP